MLRLWSKGTRIALRIFKPLQVDGNIPIRIISDLFLQHFWDIYRSSNPELTIGIEEVIHPSISVVKNETLYTIPSADEIHQAVVSIGATKAPGPDGMTIHFYQLYWPTIWLDVINMVQAFFRSRALSNELNQTFITLIPKNATLMLVSHFQPISLCNVAYKIISKLMTWRSKLVMHELISVFQAAFVPGRSTQENLIIAQEILHSIKFKQGRKGLTAIKLNMEKAYDRLEWKFILHILKCFGFAPHWIRMSKSMISINY